MLQWPWGQLSLRDSGFIPFEYTPKSAVTGPYAVSIFNFWGIWTIFYSGCTHSAEGFPFSTPSPTLVLIFLTIAKEVWGDTSLWFCLAFPHSDVEQFMYLLAIWTSSSGKCLSIWARPCWCYKTLIGVTHGFVICLNKHSLAQFPHSLVNIFVEMFLHYMRWNTHIFVELVSFLWTLKTN